MKYDINNLLDLDYLKSMISQLENEISVLKEQSLEIYDIDDFRKLKVIEINEIFSKYNLICVSLLQYLDSDFINQDWEFADLFADDINYSKEEEAKLRENALLELGKLNDVINLNNQNILYEIENINIDILSLKKILEILDDNYFVLDNDILWLMEFAYKQKCSLQELYCFSNEISKRLISKNKQILENKAKEDEREFESSLDDIYGNQEEITQSVYLDEINKYYNKYKTIFDSINLGSELDEIMKLSNELIIGVDDIDSFEDFCISLGSLFYKISNTDDSLEREKLLNSVAELDKLYDEKNNRVYLLLVDLDNFINQMRDTPKDYFAGDFYEKTMSSLGSYIKQLSENIFDDEFYKKVCFLLNNISLTVNQVVYLTELNNKIKKLLNFSASSSKLSDQDYLELSGIQQDVLCCIEMVMQDGYNEEIEKIYSNYMSIMEKYSYDDYEEVNKIQLNSFVLFDFDEDNNPYVISDLNPRSKHNLIDDSILQGKCDSGFQDYSDLINDILTLGGPRAVSAELNNNYLYKLVTPVYLDKNARKNHAGMIRIRPSKSSLVRFISRNAVLNPDTMIYNQVVGLLEEILPVIEIDHTKQFKLVINFASSMKGNSEDSYHECILRYDRKSPLYRLFFSDSSKDRLLDKEYDLLKDIIHMSLDAYFKLEKVNDKLRFDIIRQIGGKNTYGK